MATGVGDGLITIDPATGAGTDVNPAIGGTAVDVQSLTFDAAADALRLAEPILAENGLTAEIDIASDLPRPHWQKAAVRDALLNVIINAGQSGHQDGAIRITANNQSNVL